MKSLSEAEEMESAGATGRWKPYPKYKDSGVEWLGEVPEHWETKRLKFISKVNPSKSEIKGLDINTIVSFVPMELVGVGDLKLDENRQIMDVYQGFTYFKDNDVLIAKITPSFENGKGAIAKDLTNGIGFGTTELHVIRPKPQLYSEFLYYLSISQVFRMMGAVHMRGTAGQKRVEDFFITNFPGFVPSIYEQSVIINFLDKQTAKIDILISKNQGLIDLVQEKRTALIDLAVTIGIEKNVQRKDSGIEWLGDMPVHWETTKAKYGFEIKLGKMLRPEPLTVQDTLEPYLRAANVCWEGIDISDIQEMWFSPWEKAQYEIAQGDLIVCEGGDVGRAAIWNGGVENCYFQNAVHRVKNKPGFSNRYLYYWLFTLKSKGFIDLVCSKATIAHFTVEKFQALGLVIPPLSEQKSIIKFLDFETEKIDTLISKILSLIELLQEYRAALITAAVTGKIDVRDHTPSDALNDL